MRKWFEDAGLVVAICSVVIILIGGYGVALPVGLLIASASGNAHVDWTAAPEVGAYVAIAFVVLVIVGLVTLVIRSHGNSEEAGIDETQSDKSIAPQKSAAQKFLEHQVPVAHEYLSKTLGLPDSARVRESQERRRAKLSMPPPPKR